MFVWKWNFGVYVDIAERRLTVRAAETDANEGFCLLGFVVLYCFSFFIILCFKFRIIFFWVFVKLNLRHRIRRLLKMDQASISFLVLKELLKNQWVNLDLIGISFHSLIRIWNFVFDFHCGWMFEMLIIRLWPCLDSRLIKWL